MKNSDKFEKLCDVISALRDPETGCPWDLEQNLDSLTKYCLEEASEYVSAVAGGKSEEIKDELGDVLLQVVLNAKVAEQGGMFNIDDVIDNITEKMIRRHPHVFGNESATNATEVINSWENIKQNEKSQSPTEKLFDIPGSLSALMESYQIGRKSKKLNFDWDHVDQVLEKVDEELRELRDEVALLESTKNKDLLQKKMEHEVGDLLFSVSQVSRHLDVDPELALKKCNQRFLERFKVVLNQIDEGKTPSDYSQAQLEVFWQKAKAITPV